MTRTDSASASARAAAAGLAGLVGALALVAVSGGPVAPLAISVLLAVTLVYRTWLRWRLSTILTLLVALVGQLLFSWAAPHVGGSFGTDMVVVWTLVGVGHAAVLLVRPATVHEDAWNRERAADLACALVVPVALTGYFWVAARQPGQPLIAWAMGGDSANNLIINREFLTQGGLLADQGNAAPLATVLNSSWGAIGVDDLEYAELVRHLVTTSAQFSLVGWLLLSFLASMLALAGSDGRRGARLMVAVAAGLVPWLWFVSGHALTFGFANAFPGMLTLVLGWGCWLEHGRHPVASLTGQVLATWVAATAWGPVAIIPASWMVATVVVERAALRRAGPRLLWPGLALLAAVVYAYLVTFRDVGTGASALAAEGGHPAVDFRWSLAVAVTLLVITAVFRRQVSSTVRIGTWTALAGGGVGVWYLVRAREGLPEWWGYYPVKFTWIVLCALFVVVGASIQHPARRWGGRLWSGNGAVLLLALLIGVMALISPPVRPATLATIATPVLLHHQTTRDAPLDTMFDLMDRAPKSIAARYFDGRRGREADQLANFWMLQMGARNMEDPVRASAYAMNPTDPASVCSGIASWQGGVTVWTRDPGLEKQLETACDPAFDYRVELVTDRSSG